MPGHRTVCSGKSGISIDPCSAAGMRPRPAGPLGESSPLRAPGAVRSNRTVRPTDGRSPLGPGLVARPPAPRSVASEDVEATLARALAWYIAMSASPSRSSTVPMAGASMAIPMLAPTSTVTLGDLEGLGRACPGVVRRRPPRGARPGGPAAARRIRRRLAGAARSVVPEGGPQTVRRPPAGRSSPAA